MGSAGRSPRDEKVANTGLGKELFAIQGGPFLPANGSLLSNVEPRAVGSVLVLVALLSGLGYGGWMVLREIQKVTFAPVEQPPTVVAEVDPLAGGAQPEAAEDQFASIMVPTAEDLDRLYRPEALDVPVLVPRDGPIASLDPASVGTLAPSASAEAPQVTVSLAYVDLPYGPPPPPEGANGTVTGVEEALAGVLSPMPADPNGVQVTTGPAPKVELVAARDAWVRVNAPDGSVIFEGILAPGDTFELPATEEPAKLRVGDSGALYMAVNGVPYGPVGDSGAVTSDVALSAQAITASYAAADPTQNEKLAEYVAVASAEQAQAVPLPTADAAPAEPALAE
jgi:hypothetical protein